MRIYLILIAVILGPNAIARAQAYGGVPDLVGYEWCRYYWATNQLRCHPYDDTRKLTTIQLQIPGTPEQRRKRMVKLLDRQVFSLRRENEAAGYSYYEQHGQGD